MVADLNLRATDERWVDGEGRAKLLARGLLEAADELFLFVHLERYGGRDARFGDPLAAVDEIAEGESDLRNKRDSILLERKHEERSDRGRLPRKRGAQRLDALPHRDGGVA